jgi:hypothetical protein
MNWLKTILTEDGQASIGRTLLVTTFCIMAIFWGKCLFVAGSDAPASLTAAFASELLYVLGGKGVTKYFSNGNTNTKAGE